MSSSIFLQFPLFHPLTFSSSSPSSLLFPTLNLNNSSISTPFSRSYLLDHPRHGPSRLAVTAKSPKNESSEQKWSHEGSVEESLPNGMFRVRLDNKDLVLGYISGKIRKNFVRILPGDRVRIEVSRYDSTKGRIVYRLRNSTKDASS